jgi:predicted PurR-regulated permease PerM
MDTPPRSSPSPPRPPPPGPLERPHPFLWLATLALLVGIFARAQEVLVPLALGVVIAFALTPAVVALEKRMGRALSVALVVLLALGVAGGFGALLKRQVYELSTQMVKYTESMRQKVVELRGDTRSGVAALSRAIDDVAREFDAKVAETRRASPVRIVPAEATAWERVQASLEPALKPVAKVLIVFVLVIFLLVKREDLRDRFIRLAGRRNVSLTTRALDEAGRRIGRFLMIQSAINAGFGLAVTIGLLVIGVPYAALWGFLAALLRFVPFLGSVLGMVAPAMLAFALFDGWWQTIATLGLFLGMDVVAAYVVEPVAIGKSTGVSSIAMVVAAVFWTWLWGPPGLLLATPLTLCLVVLGRQMPRLEFLAVLLGDEPALEAELNFYQRLLARDEDEAGAIFTRQLRASSLERVFDELVVPALLLLERDRVRGEITEPDHQEILRTLRVLVMTAPGVETAATPAPGAGPAVFRLLGVPARNEVEELLWQMLARLFDSGRAVLEGMGTEALASEVSATAEQGLPDVVCITSLPPGGLSHVRYLCKRLQTRPDGARILVLRAGVKAEERETALTLKEDGATAVVFTLAEARSQAEQLIQFASSGLGNPVRP